MRCCPTKLLASFILFLSLVGGVSGQPGGASFAPQAPSEKSVLPEKVPVTVTLAENADLGNLVEGPREFRAGNFRFVRGWVQPSEFDRLKTAPGVQGVFKSEPRPSPTPPDPDVAAARKARLSDESFRKILKEAPSFQEAQKSHLLPLPKGVQKSWWTNDLLGVQEAWDLGYDGGGVKIAIMDTGVDFANPDLMGTQARVDNPASPHHGWPICFDGVSMTKVFLEDTTEGGWIGFASFPGATVHNGTATSMYNSHEYVFFAESASGNGYRLGTHPDESLAETLGAAPAFLLVDHPDTATRGPDFNTVYVDLDNDFDFRDEKPCFRGDEISYRDVFDSSTQLPGADGYPDVSGGMVYFIANGERPFPAADWLYNAYIPIRGTMVAFMLNDVKERGGNHGTTCASAAVAQGLINGGAPSYKPPFQGPGDGMVQGPAKGAKIIAIGNFYTGGFFSDFQLFSALGYDGMPNTGDEPNLVSMSFGDGTFDDDGWNFESQFIDSLNRRVAPNTTWFNSSGNGAPGYATVSSPSPPGAIHVGACTSYDTCDEYDSIVSADQIVSGDIQNWSCAGPQANGFEGVSVVAHGAWASGNVPLNEAKDGWTAWVQWGGTSRSTPEAAGVCALIYQAYKQAHGGWPTAEETKRILMNSATDLKYDIHRQGAGRVHAGKAVSIAGQHAGIEVKPPVWIPGDYRGDNFPAYTNLSYRGQTYKQGLQVTNHGETPVSVMLSDVTLEEFGQTEFSIFTLATPSEERTFRKPDYLRLLHGPGMDTIPPGTDLLILEAIYPFEVFDTQFVPGDPNTVSPPRENAYRLLVYNWTDVNGDGGLYDDAVGTVPGLVEASEIDAGEYMRFTSGYMDGTAQKAYVADPLGKMDDGIWVGLQHRFGPPEGTEAEVRIRARFFREIDCPWLQPDAPSVAIPAGQTRPITATVTVPADLSFGFHSAKLLLEPADSKGVALSRTVIPIPLNVAAPLGPGGFVTTSGAEGKEPYSNRSVQGDFSWGGRTEAGDGRFFFFDAVDPVEGSYLVAKTSWEDLPPTDIDTLILGPVSSPFSTPGSGLHDPAFGPNTLAVIGGSRSPGRPNWTFQTASGGPLDYSVAPLADGLHALFAHNILYSGAKFAVPFEIEAGRLLIEPSPLQIVTPDANVSQPFSLASDLRMEGFSFNVYGPSKVESWYRNHEIRQGWSWWQDFNATDCGLIEITLSGAGGDIDLYLYLDGADGSFPNGGFSNAEIVRYSDRPDSKERVVYFTPPNGYYRALAYGLRITESNAAFDMTGRVVQGHNVTVDPAPPANLESGVPVNLNLGMNLPDLAEYDLVLEMGPAAAPQALGLRVPAARVLSGDADYNALVDPLDLLEFSRHWDSDGEIPTGIDFNGDRKVDAEDLVEMIAALQE